MIDSQLAFKIAACLYALCLLADLLSHISRGVVWVWLVLLSAGLLANGAAVMMHYLRAWPMLPMYLGPVALPLCLGLLSVVQPKDQGLAIRRLLLAITALSALVAVLFPKDFYVPFLKSQSIWAHMFFFFGLLGRGCFLVSTAWAGIGLWRARSNVFLKRAVFGASRCFVSTPSTRWAVWGFAFWTLSMFAGELWSYFSWGTPVVWKDAAITTTMSIWFFYTCLLHLQLNKRWTTWGREIYSATGAVVVLGLSWIPDLGPFRWPI